MDMPVTLLRFIVRHAMRLALLLIAVSIFGFVLISFSPIDPVDAYIGADMVRISAEQKELITQRWGLDQPPLVRYFLWLGQFLRGNWGTSMVFNKPVIEVIGDRFQASLSLMATAWILSGILGLLLGVVAGAWAGSRLDRVIRWYAYTLASSPPFWVGLLLLIIFSVNLKLTPICCALPPGAVAQDVTIWQRIHHLILPAVTLSLVGVASITLHTRQKVIEIFQSDYILFARAQGETTVDMVRHHGLRNVLLPAITLQFASLSELFGGSILAEQVFTYPGLGEATVQAALRSDVPLLLGIVFFSAIFVYSGNAIADLIYQVVDPRIRLQRV